MSEKNKQPLPSITEPGMPVAWTSAKAYVLASLCLVLGVALGYLFRGSASSVSQAAAVAQSTGVQVERTQAQTALQQSVAPLPEALNRNPTDYDALVKLGDLDYDGQQFPSAIQNYERALAIHPENPDVRTDMATAYWYTGNADRALAEMETSLKYKPGHPQTLFNLGWVRWQGKADAKGAVEAWQKLLKTNPDYPQKQQVEQYIAKAKEHAARG
jgi:cytochrome c-type biogenesis protein CcmH/NrfG